MFTGIWSGVNENMNFQNDRYPMLSNNRCFLPTCLQSLKPSTVFVTTILCKQTHAWSYKDSWKLLARNYDVLIWSNYNFSFIFLFKKYLSYSDNHIWGSLIRKKFAVIFYQWPECFANQSSQSTFLTTSRVPFAELGIPYLTSECTLY